ncbi:MAG: hypothetical protein AB7O98_17095 [Hyphomonadaceae bacterium]
MRLILLLIVIAGVAGFFTRPQEPAMRAAADAVLEDANSLGEGLENFGAALAGDRAFNDYYVVTKYTVTLGDNPVVECWGAFTQAMCNRVGEQAAQ